MLFEEVELSQALIQILRRDSDALGGLLLVRFRVLFLIVNETDKGINFGHFCVEISLPFEC